MRDYLAPNAAHAERRVEKLDCPTTSNVLQYFTAHGSMVSVRTSGRETNIKFYMEVRVPMANVEDYNACSESAKAKVEALKKDLGI